MEMSLVNNAVDNTLSNAAVDSSPNIRPLTQADEDEFCHLLLRLEPSARCCRFGHAPKDAYLVNYAKSSLANADCVIGAYVAGHLRGIVEVFHCATQPYAEAAFVVEEGWRRMGLGWALLLASMKAIEGSGAKSLRMIVARSNWPMRALASKASGTLDVVLDELQFDAAVETFPPTVRALA